MKKTLLLAGGGTGGHLIPAMILAAKAVDRGLEPILLTGSRAVEDRICAGQPWRRITVNLEGGKIGVALALIVTTLRMLFLLRREGVGGVVVLGGRVGVPAALAAWLLRRPVFLVEINGVPGKAVSYLSRFARRIFVGFPQAGNRFPPAKVEVVGIPLRRSFLPLPEQSLAREKLGLAAPGAPVLLIFGGSMGAESLNRAALELLATPQGLPDGTEVIHITGPAMAEEATRAWADAGIRAKVFSFCDEMAQAYAAADLVICRGGAMTLAEVAAAACPALIVPYPWHQDHHQEVNAKQLVDSGGAHIIQQNDLAPTLTKTVAALLGNREKLATMAQAQAGAMPAGSAEKLLDRIMAGL